MDERFEARALGGKNKPGVLVDVAPGKPNRGLALSVHGLFEHPDNVKPLTQLGVDRGSATKTFAYDDKYRTQMNSSRDLAGQLATWVAENPNEKITLSGHSMGGRIILGAVDDLNRQGALDGRDVELNLVATPLSGYKIAEGMRAVPGFLDGVIPGARPSRGMSPSSAFQKKLDAIRFPENIRVNVFTGADDMIVKTTPTYRDLAQQLGDQEVLEFPDADHGETISQSAAWLSQQR